MSEHAIFTKEMMSTHTVLVPSMLPVHFKLLSPLLAKNGYHIEVLQNEGDEVREAGLSHVHNDTCYPALLVVGQMIDALKKGNYDMDHIALAMTQTAGGCRASNYLSLLRKALIQEGWENIPCLSINFSGLEKESSLHITTVALIRLAYGTLYGDALMWLKNQVKPYETEPGACDREIDAICEDLKKEFDGVGFLQSKRIYRHMLKRMKSVPQDRSKKKIRVGVVGEIYMKYSPLGNQHLEDFLIEGGFEPVLSGVMDFLLYCLQNNLIDYKYYHMHRKSYYFTKVAKNIIISMQKVFTRVLKEDGEFYLPDDFNEVFENGKEFINPGVKMGEGWLLTSEVVTLVRSGVNNVVMAQPFGCLPNHIVAKGMIRKIKDRYPMSNIVAIDFDPSASKVNQENRIRLMMANAKLNEGMFD